MPRRCTVCDHPEREGIETLLISGGSLRSIAEQFGISATAVHRHKSEHVSEQLAKAQADREVAGADSLLEQVRSLQRRTLGLLDQAETAGRLGTAVMAVKEARGNVELLAKLLGQLDERPQVNVLITPEWVRVRAMLLAALGPYPDARLAVAGELRMLEGGGGARG